MCEVHEFLSGQQTRLGEIYLAAKRTAAAGRPVEWVAPVTPRTVHRMSGLCLLASEAGIAVRFSSPVGLDAREATFHDDYLTRGLPERASFTQRVTARLEQDWGLLQDGLRILLNAKYLVGGSQWPRKAIFEDALLIGQYGGEHVGDSAILGGVLLRLHREYGTKRAYLLSHPPRSHAAPGRRTRHAAASNCAIV